MRRLGPGWLLSGRAEAQARAGGSIDQQLWQFDLGVQVLPVGVDDSGCPLFAVNNPGGRCDAHDVIGYAAIGNGALHALRAMIREAVGAFNLAAGEGVRDAPIPLPPTGRSPLRGF